MIKETNFLNVILLSQFTHNTLVDSKVDLATLTETKDSLAVLKNKLDVIGVEFLKCIFCYTREVFMKIKSIVCKCYHKIYTRTWLSTFGIRYS